MVKNRMAVDTADLQPALAPKLNPPIGLDGRPGEYCAHPKPRIVTTRTWQNYQ
jgi:hypothetical protein